MTIFSDHSPLMYLRECAPKSAKLTRWAVGLQEFMHADSNIFHTSVYKLRCCVAFGVSLRLSASAAATAGLEAAGRSRRGRRRAIISRGVRTTFQLRTNRRRIVGDETSNHSLRDGRGTPGVSVGGGCRILDWKFSPPRTFAPPPDIFKASFPDIIIDPR